MDIPNESEHAEGGWWKKLAFSPVDFFRTYRWAAKINLSDGEPSPPFDPIQWWKFLGAASTIFVVSMVIGILCTVQMNVLSLRSPATGMNALELIATIGDDASLLSDEIRNRWVGSDLFVILSSAICWFFTALVTAAAFSVFDKEPKPFRERFERTCYTVAALTVKSAVIWTLTSIIGIGVHALSRPFGSNPLDWRLGPWVFVACNIAVSASVFLWVRLESAKASKGWMHPTRLSIATIILMMAMSGGLAQIGLLGSAWFPPVLDLTISQTCGQDDCYAYLRSEHAQRMIIDGPVSFQVKMNFWTKDASKSDVTYGQARIDFSSLQDGGPVMLDSNGQQVTLKVKHISLTCKRDLGGSISLVPVEMTGAASVFVPEHASNSEHRFIDVRVKGLLLPMFRKAEGGCPIGLR